MRGKTTQLKHEDAFDSQGIREKVFVKIVTPAHNVVKRAFRHNRATIEAFSRLRTTIRPIVLYHSIDKFINCNSPELIELGRSLGLRR